MEGDKVNEDEKGVIFRTLAIKLKKELVKTKDELQKLRVNSDKEKLDLEQRIKCLEESDLINMTKIATLDAHLKELRQQLESSEADLSALQIDFDQYKSKATQLLQQNISANNPDLYSHKTFEEDRYKQLKELNSEQSKHIATLESQLMKCLSLNQSLERESKKFQMLAESASEKDKQIEDLLDSKDSLFRENENLKCILKQFREKLNESDSKNQDELDQLEQLTDKNQIINRLKIVDNNPVLESGEDREDTKVDQILECDSSKQDDLNSPNDNLALPSSPSPSMKGESQTNSSSSMDGSTLGGYVHIKPSTFEIISRSSVLEDAQNQIDNLTKAYLDSESTNALLSEQVKALKEEIRQMQRKAERMELAENLEYLKNVIFKFLSLEHSQSEQRKRLVPVLSTVLKLSPDETAKLSSMTSSDKPGMASSFFKL